jgi:hypothetical protein
MLISEPDLGREHWFHIAGAARCEHAAYPRRGSNEPLILFEHLVIDWFRDWWYHVTNLESIQCNGKARSRASERSRKGGLRSATHFNSDSSHTAGNVFTVLRVPFVAFNRPNYHRTSRTLPPLKTITYLQEDGFWLRNFSFLYCEQNLTCRITALQWCRSAILSAFHTQSSLQPFTRRNQSLALFENDKV